MHCAGQSQDTAGQTTVTCAGLSAVSRAVKDSVLSVVCSLNTHSMYIDSATSQSGYRILRTNLPSSTIYMTRRYSPLRGLTSSSCGGLRPSAEAFFALRLKKDILTLFVPILGHF